MSNSQARIESTEKQTKAAGNIAGVLTPQPKDKDRVKYVLYSLRQGSEAKPVLESDKTVVGKELESYLEELVNTILTEAAKP